MATKTFIGNPAEMLLNPNLGVKAKETKEKKEEKKIELTETSNSINRRAEAKTKRIQLIIQPSLHEQLKEISTETGISINELFSIGAKNLIKEFKNKD